LELEKENSLNQQIISLLESLFGKNLVLRHIKNAKTLIDEFDPYELKLYLFNEFWLTYQAQMSKFSIYGDAVCGNLERCIILVNIDRIWREHLQKMTLLREAVGWRGYGQRNPLYEYKKDAFYIFETRKKVLRHLVIYDLLRSSVL
jgi:preprotein translocase subunit SecA